MVRYGGRAARVAIVCLCRRTGPAQLNLTHVNINSYGNRHCGRVPLGRSPSQRVGRLGGVPVSGGNPDTSERRHPPRGVGYLRDVPPRGDSNPAQALSGREASASLLSTPPLT